MDPAAIPFDETVRDFVLEDPRYPVEAYYFVRDGFDYAMRAHSDSADGHGAPRHLTGAELSEDLKEYALDEYGPMARFTLAAWNLRTTSDFGEIVYNLIKMGLFGKKKSDRREDFDGVFDLGKALDDPFKP